MKLKRIMAIVLSVAMILSTMGFTVFAEEAASVSDNNLYVSTDYNSETEGYGVTRFSSYNAAYNYATANNTSATIIIEKNSSISGFCFDNNHKNYPKLAVVIKDGASMGVSLSKWDMTYPVTVEAGGTLTCARPKESSVSNIHIKNNLIIGTKDSDKQAYCYFLSDSYQDCDISIRYNGSVTLYNTVMTIQDLDAQGSFAAIDSDITVDGAFASATFFATTLTDSTMQINGKQISGGLSDFSGGENNQLGKVTMNGDSSIVFAEGSVVDVAATVTVNGSSSIGADKMTVEKNKKIQVNETSSMTVQSLTNNGTIAAESKAIVTAARVSQGTTGTATIDGKEATFNENGSLVLVEAPAVTYVAEILGGGSYETLEEANADATAGDTIVLVSDATLADTLTTVGEITIDGNGKTINGTIKAGGDLTFKGDTTVSAFNAGWYGNTITIGKDASLKVTDSRMTVSYGNIINIEGNIADAKTADKTALTPSLVLSSGISYNGDGDGVQFNVTNAYVVLGDSTTKNSGATGKFNMNFDNSIVDFSKTLKTYMPTADGLAPEFNLIATDSVVTFASHFETWLDTTTVTLDNSNLTVGGSYANAGKLNVTNGSYFLVKAPIMSSHGGNTGSIYALGGTFELADSNQAWENAGTITVDETGKVIINDFKCVNGGKIVVDGADFKVGTAVTVVDGNETDSIIEAADVDVINVDKADVAISNNDVTVTVTAAKEYAAQIGDVKYATLDEAFTNAKDGETIILLNDATPALTSQRAITKASVIDLNGKTLTLTEDDLYFGTTTFKNGKIVVDSSVYASTAVFWMFKNQTLTFDNVKITATGVTGTYLIGLNGDNSDLNLLNGSEIFVNNEKALDLDIICVNALTGNDIVIDNSKVNVTNLDGRVFFRGNYTVSGNSDIDLSGITKAGFRIEAGQTLKIEDTATVDIVGEPRDGGIHITDATAVYTVADTATVNATVNAPVTYVAQIGETKYETLEAALNAATSGEEIKILVAGTYSVPAGKNITITGAVDGVAFDNIGAKNMGGASVTFNNVTFNYTNANYTGLQHSGDLVYNNCTFNGQPFLYGTSETFNNCTFNQESSDAYNVWTYNAKVVKFNKCTFNSAGKSVLIYHEGAAVFNDVAVTDCDFIASTPVDGKAAIEMDSSLTAGIKLTIDADTTVTGFSTGNVSGNSLWNNKRGNSDAANNDITVVVKGETVLAPIHLPVTYRVANKAELDAAIANAVDGDIILFTADIDYGTDQLKIEKAITLDLGSHTLTTRNAYGGMSVKKNPTIKNGNIVHASNTAAIKVWNATAFEDLVIDVQGKGDANKTIGGIVLQSGVTTCVGSIKNVTIKGNALTNGIETYNCGDATEDVIGSMENVTIDAVGTGMLISAPCGTATKCNIKGGTTGIEIWIKGNYSATLDLDDCDVVGGVFAHDEFTSNTSAVNNGTLKLTANEATTGADEGDVTLTIARAEKIEGVLAEVKNNAVAKVNNTYYATLNEAFAAANDGDTIKLMKNVTLDKSYKLAAGKTVTLDLNGKTIAGTDNNTNGNFYLFDNRGNLTITGNGKITLTAVNNRNWNASSVVVANNPGGKLTVENGIIEHLGGTDMAYAIDNLTNGKGTYAETVINGGTVKSTYRAVRQFLNGVEAQNILTVNGGTVSGTNKAIFFHDPSTKANSGKITIGENADVNGGVYLFVTEGSTEWPVEVSIAETAVDEVVSKNIPSKYKVAVNNGYYSVVDNNPELPTAIVTETGKNITVQAEDGVGGTVSETPVTFTMNFTAAEPTEEQKNYYNDWIADFELTVNKDVRGVDGYLVGQYDFYRENWVKLADETNEAVIIPANKPFKIMGTLMPDITMTYEAIYAFVKNFDCGIFFTPEYLADNPDLEVKLELKMYHPTDSTISARIGEAYIFTAKDAAPAVNSLFKFVGVTASLDSSLALNIYLNSSDLTGTDYYAIVEHTKADGTVVETKIPYADWGTSTGYKAIIYKGVAAKEMADKLVITVYDADDKQVSESRETSLRDYAIRTLTNITEKNITAQWSWLPALTDMLNYGAAAQTYFGYNTDDLANVGAEAFKGYASPSGSYTLDKEGCTSSGSAVGATVTFAETLELNFYFENVTEDMYAEYSYTTHLGTKIEETVYHDSFIIGYGYTGVVVPVAIADAATLVTVTLFNGNGSVAGKATYAVKAYLKDNITRPDAIFDALAKFATSAKAAFAKK